jgi:hypothetical protein
MNDQVKPNPQPAAGEPGKANGTPMVVVACKLPNGLICELGKFGDDKYRSVRLNGPNSNRIVGNTGFGLTDVSKEFWDAWLKANGRLEFVKKGFVFVHNDRASAEAEAEDRKALRTGLEPLDSAKPLPGIEVDKDHFATGKREMARMGVGR